MAKKIEKKVAKKDDVVRVKVGSIPEDAKKMLRSHEREEGHWSPGEFFGLKEFDAKVIEHNVSSAVSDESTWTGTGERLDLENAGRVAYTAFRFGVENGRFQAAAAIKEAMDVIAQAVMEVSMEARRGEITDEEIPVRIMAMVKEHMMREMGKRK